MAMGKDRREMEEEPPTKYSPDRTDAYTRSGFRTVPHNCYLGFPDITTIFLTQSTREECYDGLCCKYSSPLVFEGSKIR
jgi:hypothetical protein